MNPPLTALIGEFAATARRANVPPQAFDVARLGFLDCVATTVAGAREPAVKLLRGVIGAPGVGFVSALADGVSNAALVNGTAAHVLDYDDVALQGHPSVVLVSAIFAVAEELDASGRDMLLAYVVGYEVWAELVERDSHLHHNKGWHPTAVFGVVAAAAAVSVLMRLDRIQAANAVAVAASMASGVVANFGSMTKSLHVGRAAQSAIQAAALARAGFTGSADAIEHKQGFLGAISPAGAIDTARGSSLGDIWRITVYGLNIKPYPVCYCSMRLIDSALDLAASRPVALDGVAAINVHLGRSASGILRNTSVSTGLEAKFSAEFAVACALFAGRVGLAELTDEFVNRPEIQSLCRLVRRNLRDDAVGGDLPMAVSDRVDIVTVGGEIMAGPEVAHARGAHQRPLTEQEMRTKFDGCLSLYDASSRQKIFDQLRGLDGLQSCRGLVSALAAGQGPAARQPSTDCVADIAAE